MIRRRFPLLPAIAALPLLAASAARGEEARQDLLRFTNGDQLHGSFLGVAEGPSVQWRREDLGAPANFRTDELRQVVLRGGRPLAAAETHSHIALANGDRIPGRLHALDGERVMIESDSAGMVTVPRDQVAMLAPSPLGGRIRYVGPYAADDFLMVTPLHPEGIVAARERAAAEAAEAEEADPADAAEAPEEGEAAPAPEGAAREAAQGALIGAAVGGLLQDGIRRAEIAQAIEQAVNGNANQGAEGDFPPVWSLSGAALYWHHENGGTALAKSGVMDDRAILRFDLAWKSRLNFAIAFHSDFYRPEPGEPEAEEGGNANQVQPRRFGSGDANAFPWMFGNSYVLQFMSTYVVLHRVGFDENDRPFVDRIQSNMANVRLGEVGSSLFELRANRQTGEIVLFLDGEFAIQWSEGGAGDALGGYAGKGDGLGFMVTSDNAPTRLTDIVVAEWNGMPDAARSLQVDEQDIVLLTNGTDRFSGDVKEFRDGAVFLESRYGEFRFPLDDIAEIRFARDRVAKSEPSERPQVAVRFHPQGKISGRAIGGDASTMRLLTPHAGELELQLDSAVMIEFKPSTSFLDDWDEAF